MIRFGFATLLVLMASSALFGRANIALKNRVPNQYPGYCSWACIEMLCRHENIKAGYGLVEARKKDPGLIQSDGTYLAPNFGTDETVMAKLDELRIKYVLHPSNNKKDDGIEQIKDAVKNGHGAVVSFLHGLPTTNECHAVVIVDWREDSYDYIDPNKQNVLFEGTIEWFRDEWTGFVLTLEK